MQLKILITNSTIKPTATIQVMINKLMINIIITTTNQDRLLQMMEFNKMEHMSALIQKQLKILMRNHRH